LIENGFIFYLIIKIQRRLSDSSDNIDSSVRNN